MMLGVAMMATATTKTNFTLVIDAGHGGGDSGAVGAISKEKNLTLKFALAFGRMVEQNCPDVRVIYTRKTDKFVELYRRAEIANQAKADLFISVHINALPKGRVARGFQTYTLGTSKRTGKQTGVLQNLEVAKRENSVIFMEKDYQQTYHGYDPNSPESDIMFEFIQDKNMENSVELAKYMQRYVCQATGRQDMGAQQDNLAVLRLSSMPGALLELGFISTRDEEEFMNSARAETLYATGMFNAFLNYRKRHGGNITIPYKKIEEAEPERRLAPLPDAQVEEPQEQVAEARVEPVEVRQVNEPALPVVESQVKAESKPVAAAATTDAPVFKVQILSSSSKLKPGDARFKGLSDVDSYRDGGMYKYTVGASTDYNAIYRLRKQVAATIPEAFIVAFKGGQRMDVNAAIREFKSKK
jgi:N-acetylmuramoyl-L-alanine amidase